MLSVTLQHVFLKASYWRFFLCVIVSNLSFQKTAACPLQDHDTLQQKGAFYIIEGTLITNINEVTAEKKYVASGQKPKIQKIDKCLVKENSIQKQKKCRKKINVKQIPSEQYYAQQNTSGSVFSLQNTLRSSGITVRNDNQIKKQNHYILVNNWSKLNFVLILIGEKIHLYIEGASEILNGNFVTRPPPYSI